MLLLPIPEYRPDLADYEGEHTTTLANVLPRGDGYGPFPDFTVYSQALPGPCRGYFYARNTDGSITIFAATSTRLWRLDNSNFVWTQVSKAVALASISNGSPAVFTKTGHGLSANDQIVLSTTGSLPTGLSVATRYYVISAGLTADEFRVSATVGGSAINTSSAGSGTHSFTGFYSAVQTNDQWQFAQFGSVIIAVQANTAPQAFTLGSSTEFADLGGSPPQARYVTVVGRFVVLSGLLTNPYRIQWSGLNAITTWTSGTSQSDFQDLPKGGVVRGVSGGEYGVIFQDSMIRRMTFAPGSPTIFQIDEISEERGLFAPLSVIRSGDRVLFISPHGFQMMSPGGYPEPIGRERVDRTFFADVDTGSLQLCIGASDPNGSRAIWAYKSRAGQAGLFDKLLCYDWALNRWSPVNMAGEYLAPLARPGLTLENLDSINASIDPPNGLSFSFDDVSTGALSSLSMVNSDHRLGFFTGSNLEATLVTAERGADGRRLFVRGFRPITDAATVYGSVSQRETQQASASFGTESLVNAVGVCPQRISSRYARARIRIPAGTSWTYCLGAEPDVTVEGTR